MNPVGFCVKGASGSSSLFLDKDRATDKAVTLRGTVTPLFSLKQVIKALEAGEGDFTSAIDFLDDLKDAS